MSLGKFLYLQIDLALCDWPPIARVSSADISPSVPCADKLKTVLRAENQLHQAQAVDGIMGMMHLREWRGEGG